MDDNITNRPLIVGLLLSALLTTGVWLFALRHEEQIQRDVEARNGYLTVDLGSPSSVEITSDGSVIQFRMARVEMYESYRGLDTAHEYQLLIHRDYSKRNFLYDKETKEYTRVYGYFVTFKD